ncbi:hypothetical protein MY04_4460 [Flammeovirga sp. MY04]|uniref:DUF6786 family protein n=1 Tax=Flammeovirga sp. MY04 TaxID=1191459 RepID=UPI0008245753|nr:DUF6786 family protein [Flammeovirga sp. MY04]ANQ51796.2 hypothetical protein MY04_4460 [Flammeovirga sp. MY04]
MKYYFFTLIMAFSVITGCDEKHQIKEGTFEYDIDFLKQHQETIVLTNNDGKSRVAVVPAYQGRIMTSSASGEKGNSYGWLNYEAIASDKLEEKINVYGGEDRFWMGPEGGQYSIFFKNGDEFTFDKWQTPRQIDTEVFEVVSQSTSSASFQKEMKLENYQGFPFHIQVNRAVNVFDQKTVEQNLGIDLHQLQLDYVGVESVNEIKNIGHQPWSKDTGLLSIWILGMLKPSDQSKMIVTYKGAPEYKSYFGDIPSDNIAVKNDMILLKADGKHRTKIGLAPENTNPLIGSYDTEKKILTVCQFSFGEDKEYVNSLWEHQETPYQGDVVNVYNDGPLEDGGQLGPFYELESSSPAKELGKNESVKHSHITYHFEGDEADLNSLCQQLFKVQLSDISI